MIRATARMDAEEARRRTQGVTRLVRPHDTRRAFLLLAALVALPAAAQVQTYSKPGTAAPNATGVQGVPGGIPVPISGTINSAGAADTVGPDATFNANSVCATVATAGQLGAGFFLAAGTLAATLTPSISSDATPAGASCTGGNYTATKFVDVNQNTAAMLVVTNPNAFQNVWIQGMPSTRCAKVCTTAFTSGSALGHLTATTLQPPVPAAGADVTDRPARQLGKVYGSDGNPIATANTGRPQIDCITGCSGGASDPAATAAASESATTRSASTSALRVLDTAQAAGSQLVTLQGTAANGARVDVKASALPTGAATETTLGTRAADATLTGGTAKAIVRGGAKGSTAAADVTSTASGANHQPADVILYDAAGSALDPRTRSWTLSSGTDSVNVGNFPATYDTSDRAARLLGIVYGNLGQLQQTATNLNLKTELAVGAALIDPRSIRVLTSADVVSVVQGTAATLAGAWPIKLTDGTNTMPTMDAAARAGFVKWSDGSNTAAVKAASTAAAAADPAGVVALSPNSPLPVGTNTLGKVDQGAPNTSANRWKFQQTDGTTDVGVTTANEEKVNAPDVTSSGSITAQTPCPGAGCVSLTLGGNKSSAGVSITGTWTGTLQFEGSFDGTTFFQMSAFGLLSGLNFQQTTVTGGNFTFQVGGLQQVRINASAAAWTGTASISWRATAGTNGFSFSNVRIQNPTSNGPVANVDATLNALRVTGRPFEVLGVYHVSGRTATYAGLAASAPLVALRNPSATVLIIPLRFKVMVTTTVAASTAGATQRELVIGRSWTVSDTGGTTIVLTTNNNKLRTSHATSIADLKHGAPLTAGTRTLDANAMGQAFGWQALNYLGALIGGSGSVGATAATLAGATYGTAAAGVDLIDRRPDDEYPIVLAQNEGLLLRLGPDAQPSGATNQTYFDIVWAEATAY